MKILFVDKNKELVQGVAKVFKTINTKAWNIPIEYKAKVGTIFKEKGVIVTASNPDFDMSGGLDLQIAKKYPNEINNAHEFKKTQHLFFTISVDRNKKSSKKKMFRALSGVFLHHINTNQTILLSGLGTGIGGLTEDDFLEVMEKVCSADLSFTEFGGMTVREFMGKYNLKATNGKLVLFKGVKNRKSPMIGDKKMEIEYKKGKIIKDKYVNFRVYDSCAHGLHVCPTEKLAKAFGDTVIRVEVDIMDFVAIPSNGEKVRVKQLKVLD